MLMEFSVVHGAYEHEQGLYLNRRLAISGSP